MLQLKFCVTGNTAEKPINMICTLLTKKKTDTQVSFNREGILYLCKKGHSVFGAVVYVNTTGPLMDTYHLTPFYIY
jgi:hypothetical protein